MARKEVNTVQKAIEEVEEAEFEEFDDSVFEGLEAMSE